MHVCAKRWWNSGYNHWKNYGNIRVLIGKPLGSIDMLLHALLGQTWQKYGATEVINLVKINLIFTSTASFMDSLASCIVAGQCYSTAAIQGTDRLQKTVLFILTYTCLWPNNDVINFCGFYFCKSGSVSESHEKCTYQKFPSIHFHPFIFSPITQLHHSTQSQKSQLFTPNEHSIVQQRTRHSSTELLTFTSNAPSFLITSM